MDPAPYPLSALNIRKNKKVTLINEQTNKNA